MTRTKARTCSRARDYGSLGLWLGLWLGLGLAEGLETTVGLG